jgi:hypothetical protein
MSIDFSNWQVTPTRSVNDFRLPLSLEQKIDVFFERTDGWQLQIADRIINGVTDKNGIFLGPSETSYAVLSIVFSFFEAVAKYEDGYVDIHETERYFKQGVRSLFPEIDAYPELLDIFYKHVRCGLYHFGFTNPRVFIRDDFKAAMAFTKERRLVINPSILIMKLREYLKCYVEMLHDAKNTTARANFEKRFDFLNECT